VALAKWLSFAPEVIIFDEPTRGIDIGAKTEIYSIMGELAARGAAIVMVSSELPELISVADRIMVMQEGRMKGIVSKEEATQMCDEPGHQKAQQIPHINGGMESDRSTSQTADIQIDYLDSSSGIAQS
jgi:ABC-type multidrug transport system ATPase subunit